MTLQGAGNADRYRAALDSVFATDPYQWSPPPPLLQLLKDWWALLINWLEGLRTDNPLLFRIFFVAILIVWLAIFAHAAWLVWHTVRGAARSERASVPAAEGEPRDADWYSRAADRMAEEGRFVEALQLAFVAIALTLDTGGLLKYQPSKTPAECAREARLGAVDRDRLRGLVRTLYAGAFGGRALGADNYRRWRELGAGPWHAPAH
jgi:Domain of unknown function (DUF4129)